jgi:folate-binding protein YgfZ
MRSPLLDLPGAVSADGIDAPVAAHYGSFIGEARTLDSGEGFVDLSHRDVLRLSGADRLTFLHSLTTQYFEGLAPGVPVQALVLSPQGHVEHHLHGVDDGEAFTAHVEPGTAPALIEFLDRMKFMMRVEIADLTDDFAVAWRPGRWSLRSERSERLEGFDVFPREKLTAYAEASGPACGLWAYDALRIARGEPRFGVDTDHRTIPNEMGWIGPAVHLEKGCYRGQETVARVHTLGRPPRRLVMLHLDGTENRLPEPGTEITLPAPRSTVGEPDRGLAAAKQVGFVGSAARHHELGPIALAVVKRNVPVDAVLEVGGIPAGQEVIVDPEVGLHVRPKLG